jgi:thioester reductase-like protein
MSKEDEERLINEVNCVIHSAATIGFQERLDNSIKLNVYGSLRVLEFSKRCKNLFSHCHISTVYVNSPLRNTGVVHEKIYPLKLSRGETVEKFCERVCNMKPNDIEKLTKKLLKKHGHPNTYTFSKSLSEMLLTKKRGMFKIKIRKCTIVNCKTFNYWSSC